MNSKDLRKLQLIELELLLELDSICRKHNIQYWLSAGTLLGAVRHKGFIPWDDDADIRMLRKEYDRFCAVCEKELNTDRYFLQNHKTDKEYRWAYAKFRRKGTEYLRKGQEIIKCMTGVSIDIFVIDNVPDNYLARCLFHRVRRGCIKTLWSVVGVTEDPTAWKRMLYHALRHVPKQIPLAILEWLASVTNRKKTLTTCCIGFYKKEDYEGRRIDSKYTVRGTQAEWFDESFEIEFEGFLFYAFKGYKEYLEYTYGTYMQIPDKKYRYVHEPTRYCLNVDINLRGRDMKQYMSRISEMEEITYQV